MSGFFWFRLAYFVIFSRTTRPNLKDLYVWSFSSHSRIFHSFGDVIITGEGLQILTYARHSWPSLDENSSFHKTETWLKPYGNFMLRFPIWFPQCVNHYIVSASFRKVYACGNLTVRVSIWFPQRVNHYIVSGSFRMRKPGRNCIHMLST